MGNRLLLDLALWTVVVPAAVMVSLLWVGHRLGATAARASGALAWAVAYLSAHAAIAGVPAWPPVNSTEGFVYVVGLGTVLAVASALRSERRRGRARDLLADAAFVFLLLWLTLRPMIRYHWSARESLVWVAGIVAAIVSLWLATRDDGGAATSLWILWALAFGAAAIALGLSSTALLAQLAAVCTVLAVGARLLAGRFPALAFAHRLCVGSLVVLVLSGAFYADLGAWRGAALLLAPAAGGAVLRVIPPGGRARLAASLVAAIALQAPVLISSYSDFRARGAKAYDYGGE